MDKQRISRKRTFKINSEYLLVAAVILLMIAFVTVNLSPRFGILFGNIGSGSMVPTLKIGTMIVAVKVEPELLQKGDIIVFQQSRPSENYMCHRIAEVRNTTPLTFITKGDNYPEVDSEPVTALNVIGRVDAHLPALGYLVQFEKSGIGLLLSLILPALILMALCGRSLLQELKKMRTNKAE